MVIMALDHVRDYFHYGTFFGAPTDLETTTPFLFFTRIITHYCAPVFVLLTGTSSFLYGQKQDKNTLFKFLFSRGLWLIFLEISVINFVWFFDISYSFLLLQVIWAIGCSMIVLSFLIYLPRLVIFSIGALIVVGHNFLDGFVLNGTDWHSILWYVVHQEKTLALSDSNAIYFAYPVLPWAGLMALGYCLGSLFTKDIPAEIRIKKLFVWGSSMLVVFITLRITKLFGDNLNPWELQNDLTTTIMALFKTTKYPPSFHYVLMTIGPAFLILASIEKYSNKITQFFVTFGRVPLFYYVLHILVIHALALIVMLITGEDWTNLIIDFEAFQKESLGYEGYPLVVTYIIWIGVVAFLFPLCKWYMNYKKNSTKWWLSYL